MNKEIINNKHAINIYILFLIGSAILLGTSEPAKQDAWISVIIAHIAFIPLVLIYNRVMWLYPEKNLYDIITEIFGKIAGNIIIIIYIFFSVHVGSLVLRDFSEFITVVTMPETPQLVLQIFLSLFCIWIVKAGIEVMGRWSRFVVPIVLIAILTTLLISVKDMNWNYLKPIGGAGFKNIIKGAHSTFSLPLGESIFLLSIFRSIDRNKKNKKIFWWGLGIAFIAIISATLRNQLVLGNQNLKMLYFPSYFAASILSVGEFLTRIEVLIGTNFLLSTFIKLSICLYSACMGLSKLFNIKEYRNLVMPTGLLIMMLSTVVYSSTVQSFEWLPIFTYYALPFEVILPVIIWIGVEIKHRISKKSDNYKLSNN